MYEVDVNGGRRTSSDSNDQEIELAELSTS